MTPVETVLARISHGMAVMFTQYLQIARAQYLAVLSQAFASRAARNNETLRHNPIVLRFHGQDCAQGASKLWSDPDSDLGFSLNPHSGSRTSLGTTVASFLGLGLSRHLRPPGVRYIPFLPLLASSSTSSGAAMKDIAYTTSQPALEAVCEGISAEAAMSTRADASDTVSYQDSFSDMPFLLDPFITPITPRSASASPSPPSIGQRLPQFTAEGTPLTPLCHVEDVLSPVADIGSAQSLLYSPLSGSNTLFPSHKHQYPVVEVEPIVPKWPRRAQGATDKASAPPMNGLLAHTEFQSQVGDLRCQDSSEVPLDIWPEPLPHANPLDQRRDSRQRAGARYLSPVYHPRGQQQVYSGHPADQYRPSPRPGWPQVAPQAFCGHNATPPYPAMQVVWQMVPAAYYVCHAPPGSNVDPAVVQMGPPAGLQPVQDRNPMVASHHYGGQAGPSPWRHNGAGMVPPSYPASPAMMPRQNAGDVRLEFAPMAHAVNSGMMYQGFRSNHPSPLSNLSPLNGGPRPPVVQLPPVRPLFEAFPPPPAAPPPPPPPPLRAEDLLAQVLERPPLPYALRPAHQQRTPGVHQGPLGPPPGLERHVPPNTAFRGQLGLANMVPPAPALRPGLELRSDDDEIVVPNRRQRAACALAPIGAPPGICGTRQRPTIAMTQPNDMHRFGEPWDSKLRERWRNQPPYYSGQDPSEPAVLSRQGITLKLTYKIADGGAGRVMLAEHGGTGKKYAVKTVHKWRGLLRHMCGRRTLIQEKEMMVKINQERSPYLVQLLMSWEDEKIVFFVMPLYAMDLYSRMIKFAMSPHDRELYCAELIAALQTLCKLGIIHHDIKPNNILIDFDGRAVISDFGIAKAVDEGEYHTWREYDGRAGTGPYMAPEMVSSDHSRHGHGAAVDVWSLGIVFLEILGLADRWNFRVEAYDEVRRMHTRMLPLRFDNLPEDVSDIACTLLPLMLSESPARRIGVQDLHRYIPPAVWNQVITGTQSHDWKPDQASVHRKPLNRDLDFVTFQHHAHEYPLFDWCKDGTKINLADVFCENQESAKLWDFEYCAPSAFADV